MATKRNAPRKWFSRPQPLHDSGGNKLTKRDIERNCKAQLRDIPGGQFWKIVRFDWTGPKGPKQIFHLAVFITPVKFSGPQPPGDLTVPHNPGGGQGGG